MDRTFVERLLVARDHGGSPFESWRRKEEVGLPRRMELCFVRPLERLEERDWQDIILHGAAAGARYLECIYRTHLAHADDAVRLCISCQTHYILPLMRAGVVGGGFAFPFRAGGTGIVSVPLYPLKDIPPESRQVISADEVHQKLRDMGCTPSSIPPQSSH